MSRSSFDWGRLAQAVVFPASMLLALLFAAAAGFSLGSPIGAAYGRRILQQRFPLRLGPAEVVLLYIGSSSCSFSQDPRVKTALAEMADSLKAWAIKAEIGFVSIGIAADRKPENGLRHLENILDFQEYSSGGGWTNYGILSTSRDPGLSVWATPQVLVMTRRWKSAKEEWHGPGEFLNQSAVARMTGVGAIVNWHELRLKAAVLGLRRTESG